MSCFFGLLPLIIVIGFTFLLATKNAKRPAIIQSKKYKQNPSTQNISWGIIIKVFSA